MNTNEIRVTRRLVLEWVILVTFLLVAIVYVATRHERASEPTPEVSLSTPLVVTLDEDPFPCLDIQRRALERKACARLGCVCRGGSNAQ